jgi:A/G-specific adenine glycosylase
MTRTKKSKPGGKKRQSSQKTASTTPDIEELYEFTDDKAKQVKIKLVEWYDKNKRTMPWRHSTLPDTEAELHQRAYEVWVSEIMLQQTRVETVIEYYKKWMIRFPTVKSLADATIEDVNTQWAGLGYYRRAKFLHEAAKKLVEQ